MQELVSRLTQTPIETHNSSTNATLHNAVTFPFGHSLYVDATHEVVVLNGKLSYELVTWKHSYACSSSYRVEPFELRSYGAFAYRSHTQTPHVQDS